MKKILLLAGLLYFIPFAGTSQFKEKKKPASSSNSDNSNNGGNSNSNSNSNAKDKNKPEAANNPDFNGNYDAPQAFTATFTDGTTMDYTLSNRNPDKIARLAIWAPANFNIAVQNAPSGPDAPFGLVNWDLIGASYYQPDVFYSEVNLGFTPIDWDLSGMIFFKEWSKVGKMNLTLKSHQSGNVITRYETKVDMPAKGYLGLHLGFGIRNWGNVNETTQQSFTYTDMYGDVQTDTYSQSVSYTYNTPQITLGIGYMGVMHYSLFTADNNKTRTTSIQSGMFLDALIYPSATISNFNETVELPGLFGGNNINTTITTAPTMKPGLVQGRFYTQSKTAHTKGNYEYGWVYRGGFATNPFGYFYMFVTFGVYFKLI